MPQYTYINDETGESIDIFQGMNDKHQYVDDSGFEWRRVFHKPNASIDSISNTNPFDTRAYVEKTGKMNGSMGDLWSISEEASRRRSEKTGGEDPIKRDYFNNYEKANKVKHFHDRPVKRDLGIATVDYSAKSKDD